MPVRHLKSTSDPQAVAKAIVEAHPSLLSPELVSTDQIVRLIRRLIKHKASAQKTTAVQAVATSASGDGGSQSSPQQSPPATGTDAQRAATAAVDDVHDLNRASEDELKAAKAAMEVAFERVALKPGDANYVHDKRVAVPEGELEDNDWDDEIDDFETDDEECPLQAALRAEL